MRPFSAAIRRNEERKRRAGMSGVLLRFKGKFYILMANMQGGLPDASDQ